MCMLWCHRKLPSPPPLAILGISPEYGVDPSFCPVFAERQRHTSLEVVEEFLFVSSSFYDIKRMEYGDVLR